MFEQETLKKVFDQFKTNPSQGLSEKEAKERLIANGPNLLPKKKKKTLIGVFFSQMKDVTIYILLAAAVISLVISILKKETDYLDTIIILFVVIVNAVIGTVQEMKAENALAALEKLSAPTCIVRRDGILNEIKAENLVVGDIVILEEGRTIPADLRLIEAINLKAGEASLTGESVPVEKDASFLPIKEVPLGDRKNMAYMSTPVTYGRGEGVVVATGKDTEIGRIAELISAEKDEATPLQKRLADLSKILGILALSVVTLLFIVAIIQKRDVLDMFLTSISLAVAAVPEGLPAVVTIVLSLGVQKMVKVNTIVRKLPSVETLGAVSVICSDKTGTLTQNRMTVVQAYVNNKAADIYGFKKKELDELAIGMSLASNASVDNGVYGDPTEIALVEFANVFEYRKAYLEKEFPRIGELPFDSVRKMMSTLHVVKDHKIIYTKGALDSILKRANRIEINGEIRIIEEADKRAIMQANKAMSDRALRVLALAKHEYNEQEIEEENLIFIGLVGMVDPPRPEAKDAVAKLKKAGIVTIMITGDHVDTAFAIAKELGIAENATQAMMGEAIDKLAFEELKQKVKSVRVFARVSPENKVQIVKALKANGEIVAMTGDGVNDAPSLKAADIGIAMGITGTDVAKGAADMVLSDDNFASIEKAVEEGRGIYSNIKKTVWFLLSSNFGEVFVMTLAIILGLPVPLVAVQILFVNLITDSLPAVALGADDKDPDIMGDKPRNSKESLFAHGGLHVTIGYGLLIAITTLLAFLYVPVINGGATSLSEIITYFNNNPMALSKAETFAFTVLGVSQLFHMLGMANIRKSAFRLFRPREWLIWFAFVLGLGLQILVTEVPFLTLAFNTVELSITEWLILALISSAPLIVHEIIVLGLFIKNKVQK